MKLTIYGNGRSIFEQPLKESETSIKKRKEYPFSQPSR